jgi:hypothetical protein
MCEPPEIADEEAAIATSNVELKSRCCTVCGNHVVCLLNACFTDHSMMSREECWGLSEVMKQLTCNKKKQRSLGQGGLAMQRKYVGSNK